MFDATFPSLRRAWGLAPAGLLILAGCTQLPPPEPTEPAPPASAASAPAASCEPVAATPTRDDRDLAGRQLLHWQEELRSAGGEPLAARIVRLTAAPATPAHGVELGLALLHTRNPGDAARAQTLLDGVARAGTPEAAPWADWARLLAGRAAEQRRLEEQADRQNQQLRENQRRIEQLSEKLEALKAIERSLVPRRPAAAPPPSSR
ncbi:hypothetical protein KGA65_17110 [Ideonella sp. B7]|uniref:hypothetical protein n=1 Tax=Ideonella benzenivorans TaxID=2831643 RepID=UPI001CED6DDF|nr:hypothetical protein [Ideonella benzenivorans]MCA6218256.1 hypothetical protein [Ideonella benzenivorans]